MGLLALYQGGCARAHQPPARRTRFIDNYPAREIKRPVQDASTSPTSRALAMPQVMNVLELILTGVYRRYAAALLFTEMCAGEATVIRVPDVDLTQCVLRVSRSFPRPQLGTDRADFEEP